MDGLFALILPTEPRDGLVAFAWLILLEVVAGGTVGAMASSSADIEARPWWIERLELVGVAIVVTIVANVNLSDLCHAWNTSLEWLCASQPVQEFVRTWDVPIGLVAAAAFAL